MSKLRKVKTLPTIYDVAKDANVSLATVSRVINGSTTVKPQTRQRVEKTIEKLGYTPSVLARSLSEAKSTTIAIVLPSNYYTYVSQMEAGMIAVAKIYGYYNIIFTYDSLDFSSDQFIQELNSSRVDGIVIYHPYFFNKENLDVLSALHAPHLVITEKDLIQDKTNNLAFVHIVFNPKLEDLISNITRNTSKTLLRVSYLDNIPGNHFYPEVLTRNDILSSSYMDSSDSYTETYHFFYEQFSKGNLLDTIFFSYRDSIIAAIGNAAFDLNIDVPEQLELLAVHTTKYSKISRPKLSGYDIDYYEIGAISMRLITKLLAKTKEKPTYIYEYKVFFKKEESLK